MLMTVPLLRAVTNQSRFDPSFITLAHIQVPPLLPRNSQKSSTAGLRENSLGPGLRSLMEAFPWWTIEHGRRCGEMAPVREDILMNRGLRRAEPVGSR